MCLQVCMRRQRILFMVPKIADRLRLRYQFCQYLVYTERRQMYVLQYCVMLQYVGPIRSMSKCPSSINVLSILFPWEIPFEETQKDPPSDDPKTPNH